MFFFFFDYFVLKYRIKILSIILHKNLNKMLYLIGFSGVGKTSIGRKFAKNLNLKFVDTDKLIENKYQKSIDKIFLEDGESFFRTIESNILKEIKHIDIVACGGGLPCFNNNINLINRLGTSIYLKASVNEILKRLKTSFNIRPLMLKKTERERKIYVKNCLKNREKFYEKANYVIDTDNLTIDQILTKINSLPFSF